LVGLVKVALGGLGDRRMARSYVRESEGIVKAA